MDLRVADPRRYLVRVFRGRGGFEYGVDAVNEVNEGSLDEFEIIVEVASSWIGEY